MYPSSLTRDISPPPPSKRRRMQEAASRGQLLDSLNGPQRSLADMEAGEARVDDHLSYFEYRLAKACRPTANDVPRLPIGEFAALYRRNEHKHGNHFVIHQHNHPIAGVHYDLRLQFSESSSISFAIPKGLPGNPNSASIGRMAIETRVHNLWNHLMETASTKTGSLLIWDTGTYSILPRKKTQKTSPLTTDDDDTNSESDQESANAPSNKVIHQNTKLIHAFQERYIRLRLHGTRLPLNYTITLRLPSANNAPKTPSKAPNTTNRPAPITITTTTTDPEPDSSSSSPADTTNLDTSDSDSQENETTETHLTNAYPGATNSIGSIYQRKWYVALDRLNSGFVLVRTSHYSNYNNDDDDGEKQNHRDKDEGKKKDNKGRMWVRKSIREGGEGELEQGGCGSFFVLGREHEKSVVTGRLAREVERDEGVEGFVGRGGWRGVLN